ncbi:MAG: hypothetical protein WKG07_49505 [Hymenobacter sp.]
MGLDSKKFTGGEELQNVLRRRVLPALRQPCRPAPSPCSPASDSTLRHVNGIINQDAATNIQGTLLGARQSTVALQRLH